MQANASQCIDFLTGFAVLVAMLFSLAAVLKIISFFRKLNVSYGSLVLFDFLLFSLGILELLLSACLFAQYRARLVRFISFGFAIFFLVWDISQLLIGGRNVDCGCFGDVKVPILQSLVLSAVLVLLCAVLVLAGWKTCMQLDYGSLWRRGVWSVTVALVLFLASIMEKDPISFSAIAVSMPKESSSVQPDRINGSLFLYNNTNQPLVLAGASTGCGVVLQAQLPVTLKPRSYLAVPCELAVVHAGSFVDIRLYIIGVGISRTTARVLVRS